MECFHLLSGSLGRKEYFRQLTFFSKVKLLSVEKPVRARFAYYEKGRVPPTSGKLAITVNILEATITDWIRGNAGNARAGLMLAKNRCGLRKTDPRTGAGPTVFSRDGKTIERAYPFPLQWASLVSGLEYVLLHTVRSISLLHQQIVDSLRFRVLCQAEGIYSPGMG
jgi:hypothetical protein